MSKDRTKTKKIPVKTLSEKGKLLAIKVGDMLFKMVDNHVTALKRLNKTKHTKNEWIQNALTEKLEREKTLSADGIPKDKRISVTLSQPLLSELERRVAILDDVMKGYSKKRFLIEAIFEKIEREKDIVLLELLRREQKDR